MFVRVHNTKSYVQGNTQSCSDLVEYLGKENEGKELMDREFFFNSDQEHITDNRVQQVIDNNHKGLKKTDAKFYMLTVNPSQRELKHLAKAATGRDIVDTSQMTKAELERFNSLFKDYVNKVMDEYAKSFNRGITKENLHYFAKVEQCRYWDGIDSKYSREINELKKNGLSFSQIMEKPEYKNAKYQYRANFKNFYENGTVKTNGLKPELQTHAHVIVSRMDKEQKMSLSPLSKSRGHSKNHKLNGKSVQVGFDNVAFKVNCEAVFDRSLGYNRDVTEKAAYKMLKNNAYKVLGIKKDINTGKAIISQKAVEYFTRQLGEKTVSAVLNAQPYLKVAYKAIKLAKKGIELAIKL